jgi:hypothetical protein
MLLVQGCMATTGPKPVLSPKPKCAKPRRALRVSGRALQRRVARDGLATLTAWSCCFCDDDCVMQFVGSGVRLHADCSCFRPDCKDQGIEVYDWKQAAARLRALQLVPHIRSSSGVW